MSGSPRRTQRERVDESSRRLAQAAIELIAEKGYAATTAAEIGLRAGYSRGMVSVRHGTKEALLDSVLSAQYESRLDAPADHASPGMDRVMARIGRMESFLAEDPQLLRAMFVLNFEAARADDALRRRIRQWLDQFRHGLIEDIQAGQSDGSIEASLDAVEHAREIMSTVIGYAYGWIVEPENVSLAGEVERWKPRVAARLLPTAGASARPLREPARRRDRGATRSP